MDKLLIIANSGRMLAQAARDSGVIPFVIDCYADVDTQQLAQQYQKVESLSLRDLKPAVVFFKQQNITQLVCGSGFESHCDSLTFLAQHFEILGNSPETFIVLQNKRDFFQQLKQLNINHPETRFTAPANGKDWLVKPQHSQGGLNIQYLTPKCWAKKTAYPTNHYYQHYLNGQPLSVLFLANGTQAQVIGFNRQLTTQLDNQPFVFAGIISHAELSLAQQQILTDWTNQLTVAYSLRGLNSLDFMLCDGNCYVLEVNSRPPASMQLYGGDLLAAHIESSRGDLNRPYIRKTRCYKAYQIFYAQKLTRISEQIQWPNGCVDLPPSGAIIGTGQPICSIIAGGKNLSLLLKDLSLKKSFLSTLITTEHDAIQSQR